MAKTKVTIKTPDFDKWKQAIQDTVIKTGLRIEQLAKETAPVDTGNYRSEIAYDGANEVVASANYSVAIEYGVNHEYEIKPVIAQALHFKQNGKDVFAKKVVHPERSPNPVMRNAAAQTQKEIPQIFKEAQKANGL